MTSLLVLLACVAVPAVVCFVLRSVFLGSARHDQRVQLRRLARFRRATSLASAVLLLCAAVGGGLTTNLSLFPDHTIAAAWFFSNLCVATAWVTIAVCQRTAEEAAAMSALETMGRAVQTVFLWFVVTGMAVALSAGLEPALPMASPVSASLGSLLCVAATVVFGPWLVMLLGVWRVFPRTIVVGGVEWRLAELPAPNPFLTHVAAMPWLRTVLVTEGLFRRVPEHLWRTLVAYEVGQTRASRTERWRKWAVSVPLSALVFAAAGWAANGEPKKTVVAVSLAVAFTLVASWFANRQGESTLAMDPRGPSPQDLAVALKELPPSYGQAMPRTSHRPLGAALYDRLFALGHDPGPRRQG